jgi:hypothetical protein
VGTFQRLKKAVARDCQSLTGGFRARQGSHSKTEFNGNWRPAKQYQNCADMRHSSL